MFKAIVIAGLVFFAGVLPVCKTLAEEGTAPMVSQEIDWREYGRIDDGEISLDIDVNPMTFMTTLKVKNISKRTINFFTLETGKDGSFQDSHLVATLNGEMISYKGPMKKIAMSKDLYMTLKPGEEFSNTFALRDFYPFEHKSGDILRVRYTLAGAEASDEEKL